MVILDIIILIFGIGLLIGNIRYYINKREYPEENPILGIIGAIVGIGNIIVGIFYF